MNVLNILACVLNDILTSVNVLNDIVVNAVKNEYAGVICYFGGVLQITLCVNCCCLVVCCR